MFCRMMIASANAVNVEAAGRAAPFNEGENHVFVSPRRFALLHAFDAADKGFIGFDNLTVAAHGRHHHAVNAHGFAEPMGDEPRGLEGAAKGKV
jgi:hypothetical protein